MVQRSAARLVLTQFLHNGRMFGPRLSTIFASRWKALWWAAGVLFLAWQLTPAPDADDDAAAAASRASAHGGHKANPWAKDSAQTAQ